LAITLATDFVELDQLRNGGIAGSPPRLLGVKPRMMLPRFELICGQNASDASSGNVLHDPLGDELARQFGAIPLGEATSQRRGAKAVDQSGMRTIPNGWDTFLRTGFFGCISLPIIKLLVPVSPSPHTPCSPLVARERSLFTPSLELCTWPQETLDRRIVAPSLDGAVSHLSLDQGFPDSADALACGRVMGGTPTPPRGGPPVHLAREWARSTAPSERLKFTN
jgi:hypothetical protein